MKLWYYVSTKRFTIRVLSEDGVIIHSAPIARWMVGKTVAEVKAQVQKEGGLFQALAYASVPE